MKKNIFTVLCITMLFCAQINAVNYTALFNAMLANDAPDEILGIIIKDGKLETNRAKGKFAKDLSEKGRPTLDELVKKAPKGGEKFEWGMNDSGLTDNDTAATKFAELLDANSKIPFGEGAAQAALKASNIDAKKAAIKGDLERLAKLFA